MADRSHEPRVGLGTCRLKANVVNDEAAASSCLVMPPCPTPHELRTAAYVDDSGIRSLWVTDRKGLSQSEVRSQSLMTAMWRMAS